jgi:uncharacterized protein
MGTLKDRLQHDLSDSIRARDEVRTSALRMALTAITNEEVSGKQARQLSDEDVVTLLRREIKKRREAAEAFSGAGRSDRADREKAEGGVLEAYLPAGLSDDELATLVSEAITETGAEGPRAMGQVMKTVTPRVAGRAEGGRVASEVKRQLGAA